MGQRQAGHDEPGCGELGALEQLGHLLQGHVGPGAGLGLGSSGHLAPPLDPVEHVTVEVGLGVVDGSDAADRPGERP